MSLPPMSWKMICVVPSVIMGTCCLVGIPGNIAVMVAIIRKYKPDNFSLQLMMSLAVSDLLSLLVIPVQIFNVMSSGWALGHIACKGMFFIVYWSMHASVFSITLLSIQRYLQVLHTQCWSRLQASGRWALLGAIWALAACVSSPTIFVRTVKNVGNRYCTVSYRNKAEEAAVLLGHTVFGFLLPFITLVSFYVCLHKRVTKTVFLRIRRTTRLITHIVVSLIIFLMPLHIRNLLALMAMAFKSDELKNLCDDSWNILLALTFINACLNPFLYAFAHIKPQNALPQQRRTQPSIHITLPPH